MLAHVVKRIVLLAPTLLGVASVAFLLMHISPGDPAMLFFGGGHEAGFDQQAYENIRRMLGLDRPLHEQYLAFVRKALTLDLGTSFRSQRPVMTEILAVAPHSIILAVAGMTLASVIGVISGITAALYRNRVQDYATTVLATVGFAAPLFWLAIILIYVFSYRLRLTPLSGIGDPTDLVSYGRHLVLPAVTVGLRHGAIISRLTRSAMLRVLQSDYIRTARAKGLPARVVVWKHALRNTLVSLVTIIGYDFSIIIGSSMVTEVVFARPGIGRALVNGVFARDYALVQGILIVIGFTIVTINVLVDLSYTLVNPQVRYA